MESINLGQLAPREAYVDLSRLSGCTVHQTRVLRERMETLDLMALSPEYARMAHTC